MVDLRYSCRFTVTDLLTLPQWTDATFSVGGAACAHRLKPLSGLQQCGSQIFRQVMWTKHTVVRSYGDNADQLKTLNVFDTYFKKGRKNVHQKKKTG